MKTPGVYRLDRISGRDTKVLIYVFPICESKSGYITLTLPERLESIGRYLNLNEEFLLIGPQQKSKNMTSYFILKYCTGEPCVGWLRILEDEVISPVLLCNENRKSDNVEP